MDDDVKKGGGVKQPKDKKATGKRGSSLVYTTGAGQLEAVSSTAPRPGKRIPYLKLCGDGMDCHKQTHWHMNKKEGTGLPFKDGAERRVKTKFALCKPTQAYQCTEALKYCVLEKPNTPHYHGTIIELEADDVLDKMEVEQLLEREVDDAEDIYEGPGSKHKADVLMDHPNFPYLLRALGAFMFDFDVSDEEFLKALVLRMDRPEDWSTIGTNDLLLAELETKSQTVAIELNLHRFNDVDDEPEDEEYAKSMERSNALAELAEKDLSRADIEAAREMALLEVPEKSEQPITKHVTFFEHRQSLMCEPSAPPAEMDVDSGRLTEGDLARATQDELKIMLNIPFTMEITEEKQPAVIAGSESECDVTEGIDHPLHVVPPQGEQDDATTDSDIELNELARSHRVTQMNAGPDSDDDVSVLSASSPLNLPMEEATCTLFRADCRDEALDDIRRLEEMKAKLRRNPFIAEVADIDTCLEVGIEAYDGASPKPARRDYIVNAVVYCNMETKTVAMGPFHQLWRSFVQQYRDAFYNEVSSLPAAWHMPSDRAHADVLLGMSPLVMMDVGQEIKVVKAKEYIPSWWTKVLGGAPFTEIERGSKVTLESMYDSAREVKIFAELANDLTMEFAPVNIGSLKTNDVNTWTPARIAQNITNINPQYHSLVNRVTTLNTINFVMNMLAINSCFAGTSLPTGAVSQTAAWVTRKMFELPNTVKSTGPAVHGQNFRLLASTHKG